jgi:hypothetical protein
LTASQPYGTANQRLSLDALQEISADRLKELAKLAKKRVQ